MTYFGKRYAKPGSSPGSLERAEGKAEAPEIHLLCYGPDHLEERQCASIAEAAQHVQAPYVTWIDVAGLNVEVLEELGKHLGLHSLALEDVLHTGQRPKFEEYDSHYFIVLKMLHHESEISTEQLSMFLGERFVVTIQERPGDSFDPVRARIRQARTRIRNSGADYLAYALMDSMIDEFFPVLELVGERIETLEDELVDHPQRESIHEIHQLKRDLLQLRRAAWPEREVINALQREGLALVKPETKIYLRDCYDHTIQIMDMIETYRDLAAAMVDVYLSSLSNRMNEVMKVLTIIATIFMPLSFIVGVYGMNFNYDASPLNMPELQWYYGYPIALGIMLLIAVGMLWWFRRKRWL